MKVDMPKNTWINEIQADFLREGFWAGMYAVSVSFSGGSFPGEAFLAEVLQNLIKLELPKGLKIIRFTGLFDPRDVDLSLFVHSLRKYGFSIQAVIPDHFNPPWGEKLDWKIVRMDGSILIQDANEIWYCPVESADLKEPIMPPKHGLLYLAKGRSMTESIKFITTAKETWRLL